MCLGQGRRIVDAVTGHGDHMALVLKTFYFPGLLVREHARDDIIETQPLRHCLGGGLAVAGQHDDAHAFLVQLRDGCRRRFLDGIGDTQQSGRTAIHGDEHHRVTLGARALRLLGQLTRVDAQILEQCAVAESDAAPVDVSRHAFAGQGVEGAQLTESHAPFESAADDGLGQRVLAASLQGRRECQQRRLVHSTGCFDKHQLRLAFGQCSRLVDHQGLNIAHDLDGFGVLEQDARGRTLAGSRHDRHRRGKPESAGAGDDEHRHRVDDGVGHCRRGPHQRPHDEGNNGGRDHRRNEVTGHHIGQLLNRRPAALRLGHHLYDLRQHRIRAHTYRFDYQATRSVHRGTNDTVARGFLHRDRLTGNHRLVDAAVALGHRAVHRHLFSRPYPQTVSNVNMLQRHVFFAAVGIDSPRALRRQSQQRADGGAGAVACAQLHHLSQEYQGDDHRRRFEIHGDPARVIPEGGGEYVGCDGGDHAVDIGDASAESDKREHVEMAVFDGCPAPLKKRPSAPQHYRCREGEFEPGEYPGGADPVKGESRNHAAHGDNQQRQGERRAHPETPAHVDELGVFLLLDGHGHGLEGHTADGAVPRRVALDLRVHGACVLGAGSRHRHAFRIQRHAAVRTWNGFGLANVGAHRADIHCPRGGFSRCAGYARRVTGVRVAFFHGCSFLEDRAQYSPTVTTSATGTALTEFVNLLPASDSLRRYSCSPAIAAQ